LSGDREKRRDGDQFSAQLTKSGEENRKKLTAVNWAQANARQHRTMIAAVQPSKGPTSHVMSVAKFERFFRIVAGLYVDKQDLKRYGDFINRKIYDLLLRAEAVAKANGRDVIEPFDLPLTKGPQQSIDEFENLDEEIELRPILEHIAVQPPLALAYGEDIEDQLPLVVGGLSVALARTFKIIDGDLKNPATRHWQQCFRIFDLLI
jgi:hypothetical protein